MRKSPPVHLPIPKWAGTVYLLFCIVLVPWTIYLSLTLPVHHLSSHWDVSWVGLDIGISATLLATALLAYKKSKWVAMSAMMTGTLLVVDAWFDILSAQAGLDIFESIFLAVAFELPVAIMSFTLAYHVLDKNLD